MKDVLIFIFVVIIICLVISLVISDSHESGYKMGQIDAMNGLYKYKLDTTKIIKYVKIK